mmetsp:Transcript_10485/g.15873  ORF Transcript_10485/g.15873 Transcript_10485/m.15873 type:complete len:290 (-) Transcript_10485:64-933(-)
MFSREEPILQWFQRKHLVACLKRRHNLSIVRNGNALQKRNRSLNGIGTEESKDSKHGKTPVVDLGQETTILLLLAHPLVVSKWIIKIKDEVNLVTEKLERRVLSWLASLHVVLSLSLLSSGCFIPNLKGSEYDDNLPLGCGRDSIPLCLRSQFSGWERSSISHHWPWEVNIRLHAVSYECSHRNTSVFDFSLAKEANSSILAHIVDVGIHKVERVEIINDRIELLGHGLEFCNRSTSGCLFGVQRSQQFCWLRWCKCRGATGEEEGRENELHCARDVLKLFIIVFREYE